MAFLSLVEAVTKRTEDAFLNWEPTTGQEEGRIRPSLKSTALAFFQKLQQASLQNGLRMPHLELTLGLVACDSALQTTEADHTVTAEPATALDATTLSDGPALSLIRPFGAFAAYVAQLVDKDEGLETVAEMWDFAANTAGQGASDLQDTAPRRQATERLLQQLRKEAIPSSTTVRLLLFPLAVCLQRWLVDALHSSEPRCLAMFNLLQKTSFSGWFNFLSLSAVEPSATEVTEQVGKLGKEILSILEQCVAKYVPNERVAPLLFCSSLAFQTVPVATETKRDSEEQEECQVEESVDEVRLEDRRPLLSKTLLKEEAATEALLRLSRVEL